MITIRGENVYPSEIDAVLSQLSDYGGEHRILITRERTMDELLVRVEATEAVIDRGTDAVKAMREDCAQRLQKLLGLRAVVEIVPPDTFPRTDFKARRVVDDREVFRQMSETIRESP
jgi:phenylacetate-CoA ligase